ncbi:ligase-associated DNA damage response exonuclease [Cribrihabitans neustonicus]|uniref:ligase-associated DNA damage response exonuclease n=1 Tax=Cribrihabitans neustonicus TaxID=1429085 RepID=UPI003B5A2763
MAQSGPANAERADPAALLHPRPAGLYCPPGDFYIDPMNPVPRAMITHGHADHARAGHGTVWASRQTLDIMAIRYGEAFCETAIPVDGPVQVNGVTATFTPAGHVLGSCQITVSDGATRITVSGDYARDKNPSCAPYEPAPCDVFVTEATFGLPVFDHPDPMAEIAKLLTSVTAQPERCHLVGAYALGKAQRVIALLRAAGWDKPVYLHGALQRLCDYYISQGIELGELRPATAETGKDAFKGQIILGPPSAFAAAWAQRFPDPVVCFASGWMQVRARARQRGVELPLVLSDHADWTGLTRTIKELAPREVWVTHGREDALVRWCALNQIAARPLRLVGYEDEAE